MGTDGIAGFVPRRGIDSPYVRWAADSPDGRAELRCSAEEPASGDRVDDPPVGAARATRHVRGRCTAPSSRSGTLKSVELVVGRIGRPHGVRGDVTVEVRTDDPDERFAPGRVLATDPAESGPLTVEQARWHSGRLLVRFAGVDDREAAENLRGVLLVVDSADLPPTGDPDEFYDHELIGLTVVTVDGEKIGVVTEVRHLGQDLLVIDPAARDHPDGDPGDPGGYGGEVLVPFVAALVPEVDVAAGRIVIDPPPGLL